MRNTLIPSLTLAVIVGGCGTSGTGPGIADVITPVATDVASGGDTPTAGGAASALPSPRILPTARRPLLISAPRVA
jgi:cysteine synthase